MRGRLPGRCTNDKCSSADGVFRRDKEHDYEPDFIVRLKGRDGELPVHLILETKGHDPREEVKVAAARRWMP